MSKVRELVARMLDASAESIDADDNLVDWGMDSIRIMRVAATLRNDGVDVDFAALVSDPRLSNWDALVAERRRTRPQGARPPDFEVDETAPFGLAPMQHAYWVGRDRGQSFGGVAAHFYNEFDGCGVEPKRLEAAVRRLLARHAMLRVQILGDGKQRILSTGAWSGLTVHDLREGSREEAEHELESLRQRLSHRSMDVGAGEVFDVQLSLLPSSLRPAGTRVHINLDMLAADALSLRVLLSDLAKLYADEKVQLPEIRYSFPHYQRARELQRETPQERERRAIDRRYWQARLADFPSAPELPRVSSSGDVPTAVVRRNHWLAPQAVRDFVDQARRAHVTPAMAFAAAFAEVLTAWSREPRFFINLPLFDREPLHDDVALLVGDFTSSVLVEWNGATAGTFSERARRLQAQFRNDAEHSRSSGIDVLRDLSRERGEQVLAPIVYTSALGLGELFPKEVRIHFGDPTWIISQGPQVFLDAQVTELDGGLLLNWDAREHAFTPSVLDDMFSAYRSLLERLSADGTAWTEAVATQAPAAHLEARSNLATARDHSGRRLHDGFFTYAKRYPQATALAWGDAESMSYGALRKKALEVGGFLRANGVGPADIVTIQLPKGPEQIVAILGILAIGAAYLPVGIDQPTLRRERILRSAGAAFSLEALPEGETPLAEPLDGSDTELAYILYTSGSTGEPKGVEITHAAAMNTLEDLNERLGLDPGDRTLALSQLEFDLSVYDIFAALSTGGAVVCIEEENRRNAANWVDAIRRHQVTVINCVPALLDMILATANDDPAFWGSCGLRAVLLGGDWIRIDTYQRLRRVLPQCRFFALGGTTETAIHSTIHEAVDDPPTWRVAPYGAPLSNVKLRVVDTLGRDCPNHVPGELWIGGAGVARGYRGNLELSRDRFVEHMQTRFYRTGDRARFQSDGTLEFLGRMDQQIKLRGHRIELGEVEAALSRHPAVARGVALVGERGLTAVVVPEYPVGNGTRLEPVPQASELADLRESMSRHLPPPMLPDHFFVTDTLPLTTNGKVDRKALRRAVDERAHRARPEAQPPVGVVEDLVARSFADVLELEFVSRDEEFFSLGGDSLLATRLVQRLRASGLRGVSLARLFSAPKLSELASDMTLGEALPPTRALRADPENRFEPFPPTAVQQAYFFGRDPSLPLGGVGCYFYREYDVDELDVPRLEQALNKLIARHEMLRAVFDEHGKQRILPEVPEYRIEVEESGNPEASFAELRRRSSHHVFSPAEWPLFLVRGVRAGTRTRLAVGLDNIVLDALSILTFFTELTALYEQPHRPLPPVEVSFRDYLLSLPSKPPRETHAYWQGKLPLLPSAPELPTALDPARIEPTRFVRHEGRIQAKTWQSIVEKAGRHGLTPSVVLLTTFASVIGRWSRSRELTVNLTLFDRAPVHPDIDRVFGDFTSLVLIACRSAAAESYLESARRVQLEVGAALDHRELSSVALLRELRRLKGDPSITMPVVFTSALGVPGGTRAPKTGPFSRQVAGLTQTPQVWLDHQVVEAEEGIELNWDVVDTLFPAGLVENMFAAYLQALDWLATENWEAPMLHPLPESQRRVRAQVNATHEPYPTVGLHHGFFERAHELPDRLAIFFGDGESWSYGQLRDQSLRVAAYLREHEGVGPGDIVGVILPKGPAQIASVLGTLAAGAVYLPIGVDQPPARRNKILDRAGARLVITEHDARDLPEGVHACPLEDAVSFEPGRDRVPVDPDSLAYVVFTSGTTGEPKGVQVTHRSALNTIEDVNRRFQVTEKDRVLALAALDFDLSVYDIFGLLSVGGALVLVDEAERRDPIAWYERACRDGATIWNSVPAALDMLLSVAEERGSGTLLRLVLASGDWVGLDLPRRFAAQAPEGRFIALGGATEAAIWSNCFEVGDVPPHWRSIPYGHPLANQRFRVVDEFGEDCPDWVAGELWIGGLGVAQGYRGDPELTARKFVRALNPSSDAQESTRWYRTGDLGRYWPDGTLEFLGRADNQVKIGGYRVELGEVEAALRSCANVGQAFAMAAQGRLFAAVLPDADTAPGALDLESVRISMARSLPPSMLPERIEIVGRVPLNANGKVDRAELAHRLMRAAPASTENIDSPRGEWECKVAELWQELLDLDRVRGTQTFFELGGDSLQATRFVELVKARFGLTLPLRKLFVSPALKDVAKCLDRAHRETESLEEGAL